MRTKWYAVAIAGFMPEIITQSILTRAQEKAAKKVCTNTGIYVNAWLDESYFLCGDKQEPELDGLTASFIIMWNPIKVESYEEFHGAFTRIINDIREILDNPYVQTTIDDTEFYYFVKC